MELTAHNVTCVMSTCSVIHWGVAAAHSCTQSVWTTSKNWKHHLHHSAGSAQHCKQPGGALSPPHLSLSPFILQKSSSPSALLWAVAALLLHAAMQGWLGSMRPSPRPFLPTWLSHTIMQADMQCPRSAPFCKLSLPAYIRCTVSVLFIATFPMHK